MSKVLTFSRTFPAYHTRKEEPTFFVEKIWFGLQLIGMHIPIESIPALECHSLLRQDIKIKFHTIRAGHRFKPGDWFSPRVWSGKPYQTKQIIIAPDIQVKKVWNFEIKIVDWGHDFSSKIFIDGNRVSLEKLSEVAKNDGLELVDFLSWFKFPNTFDGQIICWNENINY